MTRDEKRAREISVLWKTESASGVDIFPTRAAVQATANLGCDMAEAGPLLREAESAFQNESWDELLGRIARINALIVARLQDVRATEPASWDAYRHAIPGDGRRTPVPISHERYEDCVRGSWIGKCIGTALGDPVEGWTSERIEQEHGRVRDYIVPPKIENDDTAYPILVLHSLDEYGPTFTSAQLAWEWVEHLPLAFTAEWAALENVKAGVLPPESRWFRNPCGAWVGAQMRGEIHGLIAPLAPEKAAELAFRDAVISHYQEGLDGAVYAAALTSLAFAAPSIEDLLHAALAYVPPGGRFARTVSDTMAWCRRHRTWEGVYAEIREHLKPYHWIHTLPSIACVVAGLMLGNGDFEESLLLTLRCGYDTDCTAGQTGALLGTLLGASRIPEKWKGPIRNKFESYVIGFEEITFDRLTAWTCEWGQRLSSHRLPETKPEERTSREEGRQ